VISKYEKQRSRSSDLGKRRSEFSRWERFFANRIGYSALEEISYPSFRNNNETGICQKSSQKPWRSPALGTRRSVKNLALDQKGAHLGGT
jgi:hypothetical protein